MNGIRLERAYRLKPSRTEQDDIVAEIQVCGHANERVVLAPCLPGLGYFVVPTRGGVMRSIASDSFHAERLGVFPSLWVRLRLALLFKKKKYLKYDEFSLFSFGPKPKRKRFTSFNQHMSEIGAALDDGLLGDHPELLAGWPSEEFGHGEKSRYGSQSPVAIVVHIYHEETWADIAGVLKRLPMSFDLIVTTVPGRDHLVEAVHRDFPDADVEVMENRGRDVRPFLALLERGRLDRYSLLCKIHGKKSSDGGRKSYMGALWRRRLLFDLLAKPGLAEAIVGRFACDPSVGMIGARAFRLPSETYSEDLSWSVNRKRVLELAAKMGVPEESFRLDFFGGTMFWVRPEALRPLRDLRLASTFPEERGLLDGGLEHATERLFATSVLAAGYKLSNSDEAEVSEARKVEP